MLDRSVHRRTIGRIRIEHEDTRLSHITRERSELVAHGFALRQVTHRERDVRTLLEIRAYHGRTDIAGAAGKYYGALREVEHRR